MHQSDQDVGSNPYSAPSGEGEGLAPALVKGCDFCRVIRFWERLRLVYNAVLVSEVLLFAAVIDPGLFSTSQFWSQCFAGGLMANVFFTMGPAAEGYSRCLFRWHWTLSTLLFVAGLGFSMLLVVLIFTT